VKRGSAVSPGMLTAAPKLLLRPAVRLAAKNFSWLFVDRLGRLGIGIVVSVMVARQLGPRDFGLLSFALSLTAICAGFAGLGLDDVLIRDFSADRKGSRGLLSKAMRLRLVGSAAGYSAAVAGAVWLQPESPDVWSVVAICAASLFFGPGELVEAWFQAAMNVRPVVGVRQIAFWTATGCRLWLLWQGATLKMLAMTYVVEAGVVGVGLITAFRLRSEDPEAANLHRRESAPWLRLIREGAPLMASGVLVLCAMQADRLLLARLSGDTAVGIYAAGVRFSEVFQIIPVALGAVVLPNLTALKGRDEREYWRRARQIFWLAGLAGAAIALPVSVTAALFIPRIFGADYADSAGVLAVHVWTLGFIFMVSLRSRFFLIAAATRWVLVLSVLTAGLNLAGNFLLVPRFGATGAAWSAVAAWAFSALVAPLLFAPTRRVMRHLFAGPLPGVTAQVV
jgi:Membrane protein involved in the export of O-antigen and teichoic acid